MSYWAKIDSDNIVVQVTVGDSTSPGGGYKWLIDNLGGVWLETRRDGTLRKNYAGIGFTYDADRDAFIPPQPYASWVLDEATCLWVAPIDYPADGGSYSWDEETTDWVEVQDEAE